MRILQRIATLEALTHGAGPGLSAVLASAKRQHIAADLPPLDTITEAELDALIAGCEGQRGLAGLLHEALTLARRTRQARGEGTVS